MVTGKTCETDMQKLILNSYKSAASALLLAVSLNTGAETSRQAIDVEALSASAWLIGTAFSAADRTPLYREVHLSDDPTSSLSSRVLYVDLDGDVIADKTLDHSQSLTAPAIRKINFRNDSMVLSEYPADGSEAIKVSFKKNADTPAESKIFRSNPLPLVDAGFDPFIRQNWSALEDGRRLVAEFLVPSRLTTFKLGITTVPLNECDSELSTATCFLVKPAGIFRVAGLFVDPLRLLYDRQSKRILRFEGLGNIPDENGDNRNIIIEYDYKN